MRIDPQDLTQGENYKLMTAVIVPRPIAFVSTIGPSGTPNLAPFSFFTGICSRPPTVCFSAIRRDGQKKDTLNNIEYAGEFVVNIVDEALAEAMNATAADFPAEIDEFEVAGLRAVQSDVVRPPRVAESPVNMECRLLRLLEVGDAPNSATLIIGEVVQFHVRDDLYLGTGKVDITRLGAVGRLVGDLYCHTGDMFSMKRPRYEPASK